MSHKFSKLLPRSASFTLVEMLVIISIISLLTSIGYGALGEARALARDARRVTLLQDLRLSLEQYYDEYGFYPPNLNPSAHNVAFFTTNAVAYPFADAGIDLYNEDIGSTFIPVHPSGVRFMQHLVDAGFWNQVIPNDSVMAPNNDPWPWRQPNGLVPNGGGFVANSNHTASDMCGGFIRYRNDYDWADNLGSKKLGPQIYFIEASFERRGSFDAFFPNDKDSLQFDGENTSADDNEYSRTALQYCPSGKSMMVFIHHCAGTWRLRTPPQDIANDTRGYPGDIPMYECVINDIIVDGESP